MIETLHMTETGFARKLNGNVACGIESAANFTNPLDFYMNLSKPYACKKCAQVFQERYPTLYDDKVKTQST